MMQLFKLAPPMLGSNDPCDGDVDETGESEMLAWANVVVVAVWTTSLVLFLVLLIALVAPPVLRHAKLGSIIARDLRFNIT